jgi:hypothetical protein
MHVPTSARCSNNTLLTTSPLAPLPDVPDKSSVSITKTLTFRTIKATNSQRRRSSAAAGVTQLWRGEESEKPFVRLIIYHKRYNRKGFICEFYTCSYSRLKRKEKKRKEKKRKEKKRKEKKRKYTKTEEEEKKNANKLDRTRALRNM